MLIVLFLSLQVCYVLLLQVCLQYTFHSIPSDILSLQSLRVTSIHFFTGGIWATAPEAGLVLLQGQSTPVTCSQYLRKWCMNIVIRLCFISLIVVQLFKGNYCSYLVQSYKVHDPVASRNISVLCQSGTGSITSIYGYQIGLHFKNLGSLGRFPFIYVLWCFVKSKNYCNS